MDPSMNDQEQNAALPSTSFISSPSNFQLFSSPVVSCHPFDQSPTTTTTAINVDLLNVIPSTSFNMNNLSPFYNLPRHDNIMSRSSSSSSISCIDPTALVLNPTPSAISSCFSSPQARRQSTFSAGSATESEDEQQRAMRTLFEENFTLSSPTFLESDHLATSTLPYGTATYIHAPDLLMSDGTAYRFDGTSLAPVTNPHVSSLHTLDKSLMQCPMVFVQQKLMGDTLPFLIPPEVCIADYSNISSMELDPSKLLTRTAGLSRVCKNQPQRNGKTAQLKTVNRRDSIDSAYSSSSSTIFKKGAPAKKYRKQGAGDFQCPFEGCGYRYNLRRELNRHSNIHAFAGKDKYRCMNCSSGLCRLDSVKRHMEAKGKVECLKKGLYQEFKENGELVRVRRCKSSWYEAAAKAAAAMARKT
ncbi:hypothetical protein BGX28_008908 [Mortierella sp. GBA30]|nr:hypothetical protein BGX28_008908 [Mortierella sp. GBA30]